jgi:hypothetical protein
MCARRDKVSVLSSEEKIGIRMWRDFREHNHQPGEDEGMARFPAGGVPPVCGMHPLGALIIFPSLE